MIRPLLLATTLLTLAAPTLASAQERGEGRHRGGEGRAPSAAPAQPGPASAPAQPEAAKPAPAAAPPPQAVERHSGRTPRDGGDRGGNRGGAPDQPGFDPAQRGRGEPGQPVGPWMGGARGPRFGEPPTPAGRVDEDRSHTPPGFQPGPDPRRGEDRRGEDRRGEDRRGEDRRFDQDRNGRRDEGRDRRFGDDRQFDRRDNDRGYDRRGDGRFNGERFNGDRGQRNRGGWYGGERRPFQYGGRTFYRFRAEPYRWPSARWQGYRWTRGARLPAIFLLQDYFLSDYDTLGLGPAPYGFQWVRVGYDALLVDLYTGQIRDVVPGVFFW